MLSRLSCGPWSGEVLRATHDGYVLLADNMDYDPDEIAHEHHGEVEQSVADYQSR